MRIGLLVDSACDLPQSFIEANGIALIPTGVRIGDYTIEDRREPRETLAFYGTRLDHKSKDFAESIQRSSQDIEALVLEKSVFDFDYLFCLTISEQRSPLYHNAIKASIQILLQCKRIRRDVDIAENFDLAVLSSRNIFTGQAVQAAAAMRMIRDEMTPAEITSRLSAFIDRTHTYLLPADLYYLHARAAKKGEGNIGFGAYLLGSLLDVTPIGYFNRDESQALVKVRGFEAACEKLFAHVVDRIRDGLLAPLVCVSYGGAPEQLHALPGFGALLAAAAAANVEVLIAPMSIVAAVNVGPGAVAVSFIAEGQTLA